MGPLTDNTPKPLLVFKGKTLLEHKFDILPDSIDEIVMIVGYLGDKIREHFGTTYRDKRVRYVEQENPVGGTAAALWCARDILRDRFVVMMGDDIYDAGDLAACIQGVDWSLLVAPMHGRRSGGMIVSDAKGHLVDIEEGEHDGDWVMNTNLFVLDQRVFDCGPVSKIKGSQELGLPQTVVRASAEQGVPIQTIRATKWVQITDPEDLVNAESAL